MHIGAGVWKTMEHTEKQKITKAAKALDCLKVFCDLCGLLFLRVSSVVSPCPPFSPFPPVLSLSSFAGPSPDCPKLATCFHSSAVWVSSGTLEQELTGSES